MKMIGSTEGDLQLGVFSKKGQKSKYFGKGSTHIPVTLCTIPSEVLNRLEKLTSQKTSLHSEGVENPNLTMQTLSERRAFHLLLSQKWENDGNEG